MNDYAIQDHFDFKLDCSLGGEGRYRLDRSYGRQTACGRGYVNCAFLQPHENASTPVEDLQSTESQSPLIRITARRSEIVHTQILQASST